MMIDDEKILNHFYDSREVFVVDFNEKKVDVIVEDGSVVFKLMSPEYKRLKWERSVTEFDNEIERLLKEVSKDGS